MSQPYADAHNATEEFACTECGHRGQGQVPGCSCPGCDDVSSAIFPAQSTGERKLGDVTTAGWRAAAGLPEKVVGPASIDKWIADQLAGLTEAELLRVKAKLDEIVAGRVAPCVHGFVADGGIETCPNGCPQQPSGGTNTE